MGADHCLGGVGDDVAGNQRVLHAGVSHSDAVTDRNRREHDRSSSGHGDAEFYRLDDFVEVHVSRHNLIVGADDTDYRARQLLFGKSERVVQTPVRSIGKSVNDSILYHA